MNTTIVRIGNSQGVRIPKPLLEESGLKKDINITVKDGEIIIRAAEPIKKVQISEEYAVSVPALSGWNEPDEDEAWVHLQ